MFWYLKRYLKSKIRDFKPTILIKNKFQLNLRLINHKLFKTYSIQNSDS